MTPCCGVCDLVHGLNHIFFKLTLCKGGTPATCEVFTLSSKRPLLRSRVGSLICGRELLEPLSFVDENVPGVVTKAFTSRFHRQAYTARYEATTYGVNRVASLVAYRLEHVCDISSTI